MSISRIMPPDRGMLKGTVDNLISNLHPPPRGMQFFYRPCSRLLRSTENHSNPALRPLKTQQNELIPVAKYTIPPQSRTSHPDPSHKRPAPSHQPPELSHKPPEPSHEHPETHRYNNKKKKNVVNDRI